MIERLASAVLIQTVKDWETASDRTDILEFLHSDWFETLSIAAGVDATEVRTQIENGTYQRVDMRATYR